MKSPVMAVLMLLPVHHAWALQVGAASTAQHAREREESPGVGDSYTWLVVFSLSKPLSQPDSISCF